VSVTPAPRTRYAKCGDTDIAYQVLGDGPHDLLMFAGTSVPIDCIDAEPTLARFHRRLASYCRIIRFDQRGIGLSSHLPSASELGPEYWAQDALAVLDAVGCERATVFAPGFAGMTGLVLAADHPERVSGLILVNAAARALWAPDYPAGVDVATVDPFLSVAVEPDAVERGFDGLAIIAPTVARDDVFRDWWDKSGNRGATPSMARAVAAVIAQVDVRDRLPRINAPTLIIHRVDNLFVAVGHGRYLGEHLPRAKYVELSGADTLYWVGDTAPMLDEIEEFLTGARGSGDADRVLATVLFTDIVGSTDQAARLGDNRWRDLLDNHDQIVRHELERFSGREVNTAGDGFVATFTSPSRAIDCAEAIVDAVRRLGIEVRVGIHAGEIEIRGDDVAGMAVHIGARVASHAGASEILVSSTLRDIVTGSSRKFRDRGEHPLKGVPGSWRLFEVERVSPARR
jgi:class 3 adenylate cyclase